VLYVVEEGARAVRRIHGDGSTTRVLDGLRSPEGITFDSAGNLYVVEDTRRGRLIRMSPDGQVTTLAENLRASEGVAVIPRPGDDGTPAPTIYVTESNAQFVRRPSGLRSGITAIAPDSARTPVLSHTPELSGTKLAFWSYAGLAAGPDGRLYVTNELSGQKIAHQVVLIREVLTYAAKLFTRDSVFAVDPIQGTRTLLASDLLVPEGLSFSAGGDFPLYVAEENSGRRGRLSRIEPDGRRTTVCQSFRGIEDVVAGADGNLYVSEDKSGSIIRIEVSEDAGSGALSDADASQNSLLQRLWGRIVDLVQRVARLFR
jgi:sugar lactone lactonase YvrE